MNALELITQRFGANLSLPSPIGLRISRHRELLDLWRDLGYKVGAEIGTEQGKYAEQICRAISGVELTCIDPYLAYDRYADHVNQSKLDRFYSEAQARLAPFGDSVSVLRLASLDAVHYFQPASLDFVFIDGNHHFDFVVRDIIAWSPIVRAGGIVAGHDYKPEGQEQTPIPFGVIEAVNGYTAAHRIKPWFILKNDKCPSWMWVNA